MKVLDDTEKQLSAFKGNLQFEPGFNVEDAKELGVSAECLFNALICGERWRDAYKLNSKLFDTYINEHISEFNAVTLIAIFKDMTIRNYWAS